MLNSDVRNMSREINKLTLNAFFQELGLKQGDPLVDQMFYSNYADSSRKLNAIMPLLNSVHLQGRYKQRFAEDQPAIEMYHAAPHLD